jgi:hypothetical protein
MLKVEGLANNLFCRATVFATAGGKSERYRDEASPPWMLIDTTGAIVELEEEVALDSLPSRIKQASFQKRERQKLERLNPFTKHDRLVAYGASD